MGLFDMFSSKAAEQAAAQARASLTDYANKVGGITGAAQTAGLGALQTGLYGGQQALGTGMETARGDISGSIPQAVGALTGYGDQAGAALRGGVQGGVGAIGGATGGALGALEGYGREGIGALRSGVQGAVGAYDPLDRIGATYGGRATEASDAIRAGLGLGGDSAAVAANAFGANPAYQFNLTQGLEAINRARAARGEGGPGGNIDRATQEYGAGLASNEWKNYMDRLQQREGLYAPFEPALAGQAAQGRAGALMTGAGGEANILSGMGTGAANLIGTGGRDIANLLATGGGREADLLRGTGTGLADLYSTGGKNLAGIAMAGAGGLADLSRGYGGSAADLIKSLSGQQTGFLGQTADDYANTFAQEANAKMQSSKNIWDTLGNIATFGAKAAGFGGFGTKP